MATSEKVPPLVNFQVSNPVTYVKLWWQKVMGKEGIDLSFKIHTVTAVLMVAVTATIGFGAGRISIPEGLEIPFFEFGNPTQTTKPTPTSKPDWKETAFTGKLQFSETSQKFFLVTTSSEAITLDVPENLNLSVLIGKRVFAVGNYNKDTRILKITDAKDMEVLPKTPQAVPTLEPTATPKVEESASPDLIPEPSPVN